MLRVLIIGDHPDGPGGISRVSQIIRTELRSNDTTNVSFVACSARGHRIHYRVAAFVSLVISLAKTSDYDIFHFNSASKGSTYRHIILAYVARSRNIPYVIQLHGGNYESFFNDSSKLTRRLIRAFFSNAHKSIALSTKWAKFLVDEIGLRDDKVITVPNGVPGNIYSKSTEKSLSPTIVFVGRLTKNKGLPVLISAFQNLETEGIHQLKLVLIGGEPDDHSRQALAKTSANVEQLGWMPNDQLQNIVAEAWALALPSMVENMPLTVLEAMSVKTAVVATHVGAIPEMISHGESGLIVVPDDVNALSSALHELCTDKQKAIKFGENGFDIWKNRFTSSVMTDSLLTVWHETSE